MFFSILLEYLCARYRVISDENDKNDIVEGIYQAYHEGPLRYSHMAPLTMSAQESYYFDIPNCAGAHSDQNSIYADYLFNTDVDTSGRNT